MIDRYFIEYWGEDTDNIEKVQSFFNEEEFLKELAECRNKKVTVFVGKCLIDWS